MRLCTAGRTVAARCGVDGRAARGGTRDEKPGKISKKPTVTPIMAWESRI
jgi:hypothetical protein